MTPVDCAIKAMVEADGFKMDLNMLPDADLARYRRRAMAAITALRQCTPEMLEAGCHAHPEGGYHSGTSLPDIIRAEWVAMVDAALV